MTTQYAFELDGRGTFWLSRSPVVVGNRVKLCFDSRVSSSFRNWIASWMAGRAAAHPSRILACGVDQKPESQIDVGMVSIAGITFPSLGTNLDQQAEIQVALVSSGAPTRPAAAVAPMSENRILRTCRCSDFILTIPGVDAGHVTTIDAFTVSPGGQIPRMRLQIASRWSKGFVDLFMKRTLVDATLDLLFSDGRSRFLRLEFQTTPLSIVDPLAGQPSENIRTVVVDLAIGEVKLDVG